MSDLPCPPAPPALCVLWGPFPSGAGPVAGQGVGLWGSFQAPGPGPAPSPPASASGPFFRSREARASVGRPRVSHPWGLLKNVGRAGSRLLTLALAVLRADPAAVSRGAEGL